MVRHLTDEHKRKLSIAHKGKPSSFKGRKHSPESRAKISEAIREAYRQGKCVAWNKGKKVSAQIRQHISE
jgi:hypothetical protein